MVSRNCGAGSQWVEQQVILLTVAHGISSTGDVYEPAYPAIGHIVGMSRLR